MILDCHTYESALKSAATLLKLSPKRLIKRLTDFDYDKTSTSERDLYPYDELLIRNQFGIKSCDDLPTPGSIHWFHATRVTSGTLFREGIKPLSARLPAIWRYLGSLAAEWSTPKEWAEFQSSMTGQGAFQYKSKAGHDFAEGPFAFLVREFIFSPQEAGCHDYLNDPEIVEDICLSYDEAFGRSLWQRYHDVTQPCVVKFKSAEPRPDALVAALMYVLRTVVGDDSCMYCNTFFDGGGTIIELKAIVAVEWPKGI